MHTQVSKCGVLDKHAWLDDATNDIHQPHTPTTYANAIPCVQEGGL